MTSKRLHHVMLRLTDDEFAKLSNAKTAGDDLAVFARRTLLAALDASGSNPDLKKAAAFIVAALSKEFSFDEALVLFDDHVHENVQPTNKG